MKNVLRAQVQIQIQALRGLQSAPGASALGFSFFRVLEGF